jgi:ABC-type phosphate transport system substrate-binding protein
MSEPRLLDRPRFARRALLALLAAAWGMPKDARAGEAPPFRVVIHPSNPLRVAERQLVADAFLKKTTRWSGGEPIRAVDLRPGDQVRRRFSESILKRSVGAVRSYWQQRIFSGRDVPPPELDSESSVVAYVAKTPGAIGYVSGGAKLTGVAELGIQ